MSTDRGTTAPPETGLDAPGVDGETPDEMPLDERFAILKNSRRRRVLEYLRANGGESTLGDLAEFVGAEENDVERRHLSTAERKRVYVGLYQCHLPTLDDANVVDFEKRSGEVTLRPEAEQLFEYLDRDAEDDTEQSTETRDRSVDRTAAAGLACAVAVLVGLSGLGAFGGVGWPVAFAAAGLLAAVEVRAVLSGG